MGHNTRPTPITLVSPPITIGSEPPECKSDYHTARCRRSMPTITMDGKKAETLYQVEALRPLSILPM